MIGIMLSVKDQVNTDTWSDSEIRSLHFEGTVEELKNWCDDMPIIKPQYSDFGMNKKRELFYYTTKGWIEYDL